MPAPSDDQSQAHDQNFKELISTFFVEFLELFLPELAATIDPTSVKFLQQEYFTDLVEGETKIVDLLAEVKLAGEDATFLVHIEPQSTSRSILVLLELPWLALDMGFGYFPRMSQSQVESNRS
ncbi:MAG: hypothetical protein HC805_02480 [Alkalinema sp. RL_2_19]|nr:hypothetical protein [Alkalinema sp. RL_2_19]